MDKESWKAYCKRENIKRFNKEVKSAFRGSLGYALFRVSFYGSKLIDEIKKEML